MTVIIGAFIAVFSAFIYASIKTVDERKKQATKGKKGHKNDAVKTHPKVSYCVMDDGVKNEGEWWYTFKSVVVFGKIRTLSDDDEKIDKLTYLGNKFLPTPEETKAEIDRLLDKTEVFEITIDHMSGKIVVEK